MFDFSIASSSLFARPVKLQETVEERRLELLKDRVELGEALSCLGVADPLVEVKSELEQAASQFVANRELPKELQTLAEQIKPLGEIYFPKKDMAHLSEMLGSIQRVSQNLPEKGVEEIKDLLTRLKQLYLQEQKRDPATAHQFSCTLQGMTTSHLYLPPQVMQKMLPLDAKGSVVKSLLGVQGGGTRAVNRHGKIFCKDVPEAPLYQYGWDTFLQVFFNMNTAASQFACAHRKAEGKTYHTQTSLAVDGDMSFSKLVTEQPHLLDKLDPDLFGRTAIAHIVGMPQDATENNFMAKFFRDSEGNIVNIIWKGFDDDRWGVHSPCRSGKENHFNNMRSIFLCFKQMYQQIHPQVRSHFMAMNPAQGILQFLKEMAEVNQQLKELLKNEKIPQEKMEEMFLPFLMVKDLVEKQYQKFCKIREFMRHAPPEKTYMDLWKEVDPVLAHFYDMINKTYPNDPYEAFLKVYVRGGPTIEEKLQSLLSRPLTQNMPLSEYLKTCNYGADDYEALRDTTPEAAAEKWLEDLDFSIYSDEEQLDIVKALSEFPLSKVTLRNCAIKDSKIRDLLKGQPHLRKLTLIGCNKLSDASLTALFHAQPQLELHLCDCKAITLEALSAFKRKKIVVQNRGEQLIIAEPDAQDASVEPMKKLVSALESGSWKQSADHYGALEAAGFGAKAAIRVVEHIMTTDAMGKIVRENSIEALEFLKRIDFQFAHKNIKGECFYHLCCKEDKAAMLEWLCQQPVKWQEVADAKGETPYHVCVEKENIRCLEILKAAGAPINLQDKSNVGPLRLALERNSIAISSWMIQNGADLKEQNWHKQNLLHMACQFGLDGIIDLIVNKAPELVEGQDDMGKSPLHFAIEYGQAKCFHKVLKVMKSFQLEDKQGNTSLMLAAQHDRLEMVSALKAKGATVHAMNKEGMNAIQIAALAGSLACLKALLGAENPPPEAISIVRQDGKTLLHLAALSGKEALVKWLATPKTLTQLDEDGLAPAHYAAQAGKWDVFYSLVQAGFPIDLKTSKGETCLMLALRGHHFEMAEQMIAHKADLHAVDNSNNYVVHQAAQNGDLALIRYLREKHKIDVNLPTKNQLRKTPLHLAAARGHISTIQLLCELGANKNACDRDDKTPLFLSVMNGQEEAVRLLIQNGAEVGAVMKDGSTLLHYAAQYTHPKLVAYLLSLKPDLIQSRTIVIDDQKRTTHPHEAALHSAIKQRIHNFKGSPKEKENLRQRQLEVVKILLRFGAEVNARDRGDYTPLHLTAIEGRPDFARLLLSRGANVHARYDKSKFGEGQSEKRTPEEHCYFWIDKLQRNPSPHEHADEAAKRKKHIQEIEETAKLLKTHAKALHDSQKGDAKKIAPGLANEKVLAELLRKPLQERKEMLLRNLAEDQGFRPESLLLLRSIENQLASQPSQENSQFLQKLQESYKSPQLLSAPRLALKHDLPMTTQKIRELWLSSDDPRHLEEIACLIPHIEKPSDIFQRLVELAESQLSDKEGKALFDLLTLLQRHEAWTGADFPKDICKRLTKIKKFKEFDPNTRLKVHLETDWRKKNAVERKSKLEGEFTEALKHPQRREETIDKLTRSLMGMHREMFHQVRMRDFRSKDASTGLSELLRFSRDLSANCLILLLKGNDYESLGQRLEFVIAWMNKSALYGDFHQAFALYEALSHPAVIRLRKGFDRIDSNAKAQLLQIEKFFSPADGYRNYFASFQQRLSPSIPAFSICTQLYSQQENAPEDRAALLQQMTEQRHLADRLILPPSNPNSEWLIALTADLYPQEYLRKKEDIKPGDGFAWERSDMLKPRKKFHEKRVKV